ncbi:hypothetical protein Ngar_c05960 [Candidatus Nitrososphaera gargensis Ga9.2]|uniref:Uncharacterized protein n=1 Tax=Nitrososphaera gargensis (strain Ga9.2) TaxID=1237085 RepID=K0IM40_NITGG|nr:hypothetical protein Ngar_c05960 [Candidatus Nitrososphaera gargensis Ga9.2]
MTIIFHVGKRRTVIGSTCAELAQVIHAIYLHTWEQTECDLYRFWPEMVVKLTELIATKNTNKRS